MDVLSGVLTGSSYATGVVGPYVPEGSSGCGQLVIALKVGTMLGDDVFAERIDDLIDTTKSVPLAEGFSEIFYPGEIEARAEATSEQAGVPLPDKTFEDLRALAESCGVAFTLTDRDSSNG
jgi:LDH2 family malate/lactate/ureidoglycolate dehydrogenase